MNSSSIPFATLLAQLADPDPDVRLQSITAIMRWRKENAQAFDSLLILLSDSDELVRLAALRALGKLGDPRAFSALQALLSDQQQSDHLRVAALRALVRLDRQQALPALIAAMHDPGLQLLQVAIRQLMNRNDGQAVESLVFLLGLQNGASVRTPPPRSLSRKIPAPSSRCSH